MNAAVRVVALGGLGEVGMNCLVLEQAGDLVLIDCGVTFDSRGLGVDVIHPDFSALEAYAGHIRGIFLTHGHEDHLGAIPYFLNRFDVPVWGPPYSIELLHERSREHEVLRHADLRPVRPGEKREIGSFAIEPIRVAHSTPDATALAIETAAGLVLHSGDFKLDDTSADGGRLDLARLRELGERGVRLLMSDSTNVDAQEPAGSEDVVRDALHRLIVGAAGRVVVGIFASNLHRLRFLGEIARATGRRVVPLGRSVSTHARVAARMGYLAWPDGLVVAAEHAAGLRRDQVLGIATGTQAEARSALGRISRGDHPLVLDPGDSVILSSRIIPGHELEVAALESALLRRGVLVTTRAVEPAVHVSGHAARPELRTLLEITRPRSFIPVHGTRHHLAQHAALAASVGVSDTLLLDNGDVGVLDATTLRREGQWPAGRVFLDSGKPVSAETLQERRAMASTGLMFVSVPVCDGRVVGRVQVVSRGVLPDPETCEILTVAARAADAAILAERSASLDDAGIREVVRLTVRRVVGQAVGHKTDVLVTTVAVARPPP